MKKIVLTLLAAATMVGCTKWENKSTEFKVTGLWTGVNQQINIQALPFLDSTILEPTTNMTANFMDNGSLIIDSAGTQIDSLGWAIMNDTILSLEGIDIGLDILGGAVPSNINFVIKTLEQDAFTFRYDTTLTQSVPGIPIPITFDLAQIQRWAK
tara:strand:- start:184 stop:648 length:465 start_codon:yes stop_codon:yes gene_type:complete